MRKFLLLSLLLAIGYSSYAIDSWDLKNYYRSDSAQIFSWDRELSNWILSSSQVYNYDAYGNMVSLEERSFITGYPITRIDYVYNEDGLVTTRNYFKWDTSWVPTSRYIMSYDEFGRTSEILLQVFKEGVWINNRLSSNYIYDDKDLLLEFQSSAWNTQGNDWYAPRTDFSTYDDEGRLIKRISYYATGSPEYQIFYAYNSDGLMYEYHAEYPTADGWYNWWLVNYEYNYCGMKTSQIRYLGVDAGWIPQTKTVSYNSFDTDAYPGKKIPVCHKGHTIYISKNALKAHLAHGDCIGECVSEKEPERNRYREREEIKQVPFTVYPNPATDRITLKFKEDECDDIQKVELADFYGTTLRSYSVKGDGDLTIPRGNLKSGNYYLRVTGDEVYSVIVIFK